METKTKKKLPLQKQWGSFVEDYTKLMTKNLMISYYPSDFGPVSKLMLVGKKNAVVYNEIYKLTDKWLRAVKKKYGDVQIMWDNPYSFSIQNGDHYTSDKMNPAGFYR